MFLCSKWKNGLCKRVTKSQGVTKFNVTKSRLHCTKIQQSAVFLALYIIFGSSEFRIWDFFCVKACGDQLNC